MLVFTEPSAHQPRSAGASAEHGGQRGDLDRVAERGAGAVRLDVADGARVDPGHGQRLRRSTAAWPSTLGAVKPTLRAPSLLTAVPRITARMWSPSASASASRLSTTTPTPLPQTVPVARGVERPAVPVRRDDPAVGVQVARAVRQLDETPPASAMSHSPPRSASQARCTATSEVEQAVCTVRLGPRRSSL